MGYHMEDVLRTIDHKFYNDYYKDLRIVLENRLDLF